MRETKKSLYGPNWRPMPAKDPEPEDPEPEDPEPEDHYLADRLARDSNPFDRRNLIEDILRVNRIDMPYVHVSEVLASLVHLRPELPL